MPVAPGETGRIFVGNELAFEGYTGGGNKDAIDGLLSSGDVGHFDEGGRLFIDGRDDDMIVSGGENVFPGEVEDLLAGHEAIAEAAVFGVEDDGLRPAPQGGRRGARGTRRWRSTRSSGSSSPTSPATRSRATSTSSTSCRARRPARCSSGSSETPDPSRMLEACLSVRTSSISRAWGSPRARAVASTSTSAWSRSRSAGSATPPSPTLVPVRVDVSRTTGNGWALRLRIAAALTGPCMRCLERAAPEIEVEAREVEQPGSGDDELSSPYVNADGELDLAAWARDALALSLPAQITCTARLRGAVPAVRGEPQRGSRARARGGAGSALVEAVRDPLRVAAPFAVGAVGCV